MALFVINEWLWEDLRGANDSSRQIQSFSFLQHLINSSHQIILIQGSKFDQKAWALCKNPDQSVRLIGGYFAKTIRTNSDHCRILSPDEVVELPQNIASKVNPDDHYLVCTQITVAGTILVTTDSKLQKILLGFNLKSITREEFLKEYFQIDVCYKEKS